MITTLLALITIAGVLLIIAGAVFFVPWLLMVVLGALGFQFSFWQVLGGCIVVYLVGACFHASSN